MKTMLIGLSVSLIALFSSCKKETVNAPATTTLQNFVSSDTSLSIFNTAVNMANETALLQRTDPVTLLIPTNAAFRAAGIDNTVISSMTVASVDSIVQYCFVPLAITPVSATNTPYTTSLGTQVYGATDGTNIYFNGSQAIKQIPPPGSTTTIYELNAIIQPASLSLLQAVQADPATSLFAEALQRTNIIATLNNGWYTVLVPTNTAFANAGYPDIASIDNADITALTTLVNYHVLNAQYFTNNFLAINSTSTDEGAAITITNSSGMPQFSGNSNSVPANIVKANFLVNGNIIIDKIDEVLMP